MLKDHRAHFYAAVDRIRLEVGDSAPKIADEAISLAFPKSYDMTREEGCDDLLRIGVINAVKTYIKKPGADERQKSFNDLEPDILPYVEPLRSTSFFVPSTYGEQEDMGVKGVYVPINELVGSQDRLESACVFLEGKAKEVSAEAKRLRELLEHLRSR